MEWRVHIYDGFAHGLAWGGLPCRPAAMSGSSIMRFVGHHWLAITSFRNHVPRNTRTRMHITATRVQSTHICFFRAVCLQLLHRLGAAADSDDDSGAAQAAGGSDLDDVAGPDAGNDLGQNGGPDFEVVEVDAGGEDGDREGVAVGAQAADGLQAAGGLQGAGAQAHGNQAGPVAAGSAWGPWVDGALEVLQVGCVGVRTLFSERFGSLAIGLAVCRHLVCHCMWPCKCRN